MRTRITVSIIVLLLLLIGMIPFVNSRWFDETDVTSPKTGDALRGKGDEHAPKLAANPRANQLNGPAEDEAHARPGIDLNAANVRGDVHGVVVDSQGLGISNAVIKSFARPWNRSNTLALGRDHDDVSLRETVSSVDGTFALPTPKSSIVTLKVSHDDYATIEFSKCVDGSRLRIQLVKGVTLIVVTQNAEGKSLANVTVNANARRSSDNAVPNKTVPIKRTVSGTTNEQGEVRLGGLPGGSRVSLDAIAGTLGGWKSTSIDAPLPLSGELRHVMEIPTGSVVRGTVTDAITNLPIADARVGLGWTFFKESRSDEHGRYALGGWTGNGYRDIAVVAKGYGRAESRVGTATTINFKLKKGFQVHGRVVSASGHPLPGVFIHAVGSDREGGGIQMISSVSGESHPDGSFELQDLRHGIAHTIVALHSGYGRHLTDIAAPTPNERVVDIGDITLDKGRTVECVVLNGDGTPRAECYVEMAGENHNANRFVKDESPSINRYYGRTDETNANAQGRATFTGVSPGEYALKAGRHGQHVTTSWIVVPKDGPVPNVTLRFAAMRQVVVHVVTGEPPVPVVGEMVMITPEEGEIGYQYGQSDKEGIVHLHLGQDVKFGEIHATGGFRNKYANYIRPEPARVELSDKPYVIRLRKAAVIKGHLIDPDGKRIGRASILVRRDGKPVTSTSTELDGTFQQLLEPGSAPVDLLFRGDIWTTQTDAATFRRKRLPMEAMRKEVRLGSPAIELQARAIQGDKVLTLRIEDPNGNAVPGARVSIVPAFPPNAYQVTSDEEGHVEFKGLTRHPVIVAIASTSSGGIELAPFRKNDVTPSESTISLRMEAAIYIKGLVVDEDENAVANATVSVHGELIVKGVHGKTNAEGRFSIPVPTDRTMRYSIQVLHELTSNKFLLGERAGVTPGGPAIKITAVLRAGG